MMILLQGLGAFMIIASAVVIITVVIPLWLTRERNHFRSTFPRDESKRPVSPWFTKEKS